MGLEVIYEEEKKRCRIKALNIGGLIIDRQFMDSLYLAPYAPHREIASLLRQVPEPDRTEVRRLWGKMQRKLRFLHGKKS